MATYFEKCRISYGIFCKNVKKNMAVAWNLHLAFDLITASNEQLELGTTNI
jgi:hypothetical protein